MKKLTIIAMVMVIGAGAAFAATLNVPFFLDNEDANGFFPPRFSTKFFIGLKNTSAGPLTITVSYQDSTGADKTGIIGNTTFSLAAGESVSFRPGVSDPGVDSSTAGPGQKDIVRMLSVANGGPPSRAGAAVFEWTGGTNDIQGRGVQIDCCGAGAFAFLLPPGTL